MLVYSMFTSIIMVINHNWKRSPNNSIADSILISVNIIATKFTQTMLFHIGARYYNNCVRWVKCCYRHRNTNRNKMLRVYIVYLFYDNFPHLYQVLLARQRAQIVVRIVNYICLFWWDFDETRWLRSKLLYGC